MARTISITAPAIAWHQANQGLVCSGQQRRDLNGQVRVQAACAAVGTPKTDTQAHRLVERILRRKVRGIIHPEKTNAAFAPKPVGVPTACRTQQGARPPRRITAGPQQHFLWMSALARVRVLLSFFKDYSSDRRPLSASRCVRRCTRLRRTSATPSTTPSSITPSTNPSTTPSRRQS